MNTNTKNWASITAGILSLADYASAANLGSEKYTYDASGNIIEKQLGADITKFAYEGNRLKESLGKIAKDYQYDGAGRLVVEAEDGKIVRSLSYQFLDKVTKVRCGEITTELFYNAEGQLVGSDINGGVELLAWDGLAIVSRDTQVFTNEEHQVGGVPTMIGNDVSTFDIVGTTLSIGKESFTASAYGENLQKGLYTGKPFVKQLEGFVFKYRNYSPESVRWNSDDPSGYPDGPNNSVYACQIPHQSYDRDGLEQKAIKGWTQVGDTGESNKSPAHDVTEHFNGDPTKRLYREWDDDPDEEMRQGSISQSLINGNSYRWGTKRSIKLGLKAGIKVFSVIDLGAEGSADGEANVTGVWEHPGNAYEYMIIPTREELTYKCKKTTHGTVTTSYILDLIPVKAYSLVIPPTTGTGLTFIAYLAHGGQDLYEK